MGKLRAAFFVAALGLMALFIAAPFCLNAFWDGAGGTLASLNFVGTEFTCQYVADDGKQAVFFSDRGYRRFIDVASEVAVGKKYQIKSHQTHATGQTTLYLVEVE